MHYTLALLRSVLFSFAFYSGSFLLVVAALLSLPFSKTAVFRIAKIWARMQRICARVFLGIHIRIQGEALPNEPALVVLKHESMFETIDVLNMFDEPAVVAKAELKDIPLWGTIANNVGMIFIDREGGSKSLRAMLGAARSAIADGQQILLFAEGTRVPHGERPPLRSGFAGLYKLLNLPVVPVALDTGKLSPRNSFVKRPGTVTYLVGETIPPGLPRAEIEARVHSAINALNA